MDSNLNSLDKLINAFTLLPGVGKKTAERYAYSIIDLDKSDVDFFSHSMIDAKQNIKFCSICGNFTDQDICSICKNRQSKIICVVKDAKDVVVLERARNFNCLYHVLHGTIDPMNGKGPNDIRIKELLDRLQTGDFEEVIMATNPDVTGEATALYIAKLLKPMGFKVSRLAQGIQMGSDLKYADDITISKAIEDRKYL